MCCSAMADLDAIRIRRIDSPITQVNLIQQARTLLDLVDNNRQLSPSGRCLEQIQPHLCWSRAERCEGVGVRQIEGRGAREERAKERRLAGLARTKEEDGLGFDIILDVQESPNVFHINKIP
jgi:hypothetical protein